MELQRVIERRTVAMSGSPLTSPVQSVTGFMAGSLDAPDNLPEASYRLGTAAAPLHTLYPPSVTIAIRKALKSFNRKIDGFLDGAVLHGAETRTSSPVTILRSASCESVGVRRLYPCGEGAGYAGGIASAAVDGIRVARHALAGEGGAAEAVSMQTPERQELRY